MRHANTAQKKTGHSAVSAELARGLVTQEKRNLERGHPV